MGKAHLLEPEANWLLAEVNNVIPLRGMTAAVFLCVSKLPRNKTLHVIPLRGMTGSPRI